MKYIIFVQRIIQNDIKFNLIVISHYIMQYMQYIILLSSQ